MALDRLFRSICRHRRLLQLFVNLVQEFLGLLSMALHVPFIGLLRRNNLLERLLA